ncbi:MAG: DsrE family protein [Candidatus Thiodiazotropha sp. (ex Semelilucina semeliformis)]|nr:DsrE family protein [Candidatus Thiodiazotropha sp. (ex Semelilucina semeliformis)]
MKFTYRVFWFVLVIMGAMTFLPASADEAINDAAALNGVKATKSVFLIDFTNPRKTAFYMDIIRGTHDGLVRQGVSPNMVLVFIGQTVKYLSTEPDELLAMEYEQELKSIAESAKALKQHGVRMEVCAVATKVFEVENAKVLPEMDVVGDGFISLIGWQTQGHKLVPIF